LFQSRVIFVSALDVPAGGGLLRVSQRIFAVSEIIKGLYYLIPKKVRSQLAENPLTIIINISQFVILVTTVL